MSDNPTKDTQAGKATMDVKSGKDNNPTSQNGSSSTNVNSKSQSSGNEEEEPSNTTSDEESDKAAQVIQRNYRGYKNRREMKGCGMSASARWHEALKDAQYANLTGQRSKKADSEGGSTGKWQRVTGVAARAGNDEDDDQEDDAEPDKGEDGALDYYKKKLRAKSGEGESSKTMGLEYWLEMVDTEHRYGSNLSKYHAVWSEADTKDNFFHWLDQGEGKDEDLEKCPRKTLEEQKLHYLSREQRYEYLVEVGDDGLLRWATNSEKVNTNLVSDESKDDLAGQGLEQDGLPGGGEVESTSHLADNLHNARGIIQAAGHEVPMPLAKLIESYSEKSSWIFVVDTCFRLYVGIKESGSFQHSSFLHGSRVLSAGLVAIEDGHLRSISPHSGHYRPTAANFWALVKCLEAEGVDMSQAQVLGSYYATLAAETYRDTLTYFKSYIAKIYPQKDGNDS